MLKRREGLGALDTSDLQRRGRRGYRSERLDRHPGNRLLETLMPASQKNLFAGSSQVAAYDESERELAFVEVALGALRRLAGIAARQFQEGPVELGDGVAAADEMDVAGFEGFADVGAGEGLRGGEAIVSVERVEYSRVHRWVSAAPRAHRAGRRE